VHKKLVAGLFLSMLFTIPALADQIVLKNGDKITGTVIKSDAKNVVIKPEYAGEVTIDWSAVQDMSSTKNFHVGLKSGENVVGSLTVKEGKLEVTTKDLGTVETPRENIVLIRDDADQLAYEKSLHPRWSEGWTGGLNLGFAVTGGNSETKNLNIAFNAVHTGLHDKLTLYTNSVYATTAKPTSLTTADANGGGIRYDHDLSARAFAFASADFFANSLQDLSLRSILGGGMGVHAIKTPVTTLDLLAGLNSTHDSFSDVANPNPPLACTTGKQPACFYSPSYSSASLSLGDVFMHKFGKSTVLTQSFLFYPGLTDTTIDLPGNLTESVRVYRGAFNLGTVTKINKWLGWQNSFGDVFVSNPPVVAPGTPRIERNDVTFATGLNISFSH